MNFTRSIMSFYYNLPPSDVALRLRFVMSCSLLIHLSLMKANKPKRLVKIEQHF